MSMFSICNIFVLIDVMLIMIQLNKEPVFHNHLKFNVDFSSPTYSRYEFSSCSVIVIQKLAPQPKNKAITTCKVYQMQPISAKLLIALNQRI